MRCLQRSVVVALLLFATLISCPAHAATPQQIRDAIERGKKALYNLQQNGNWERAVDDVHGDQKTGPTALAVYALLASGESHQDPKIAPAIAYLKKTDTTGVYALGVRCQVWLMLPQSTDVRGAMNRDAHVLLNSIIRQDREGKGFYNYNPGGSSKAYSHSRAQYAVLGMWAAAQSGVEVPNSYWQLVEKSWIADQDPSGGWSYKSKPTPDLPLTPGMTAVGVATLFITQDFLHANDGLACKGNVHNAQIERGIEWLTSNFDKVAGDEKYKRDFPYSTLYAVERIGVASGYKYFKNINWYEKGSDWLIKQQKSDGAWPSEFGNHVSTSLALLFLSRGSNPIVINKLDYSAAAAEAISKDTPPWNQRPRDVANISRWIGRQIEKDLNWQIVNLSTPAEDLSDAPILYLAGNETLHFSDDQAAKMKQFVQSGGVVLASADCAAADFTTSFKELGKKMFLAYDFAPLPDGHPIFTNQQFNASKWKKKPAVLSMSNGARELLILLPDADAGKAWQVGSPAGKEELYQLAADIYQYAVDKQGSRRRGETNLVKLDEKVKTTATVKLARIEYAGNFDPEPLGWRRLAAILNNREKLKLIVDVVKPSASNLADYKVAHLTGTRAFSLDQPSRDAIKQFVNGGGTLIVDAAGGAGEFATAAQTELKTMFGETAAASLAEPIAAGHALYSSGKFKPAEVQYRNFARSRLGSLKGPQLRGIEVNGRLAVIFSKEDLSVGLVGQQVDGIVGYSPETATDLMARIIAFATSKP